MKILKVEFDKLLELGIIEENNCPWKSPVYLFPKLEDKWRVMRDYRACFQLQDYFRHLYHDRDCAYTLPLLIDFLNNMAGSLFFTFLDLFKSYYQLDIASQHQEKSVMRSPFGSFKYKRMFMGLRNAIQSFQRFMKRVFQGVPNIFCLVDDILEFSKPLDEHILHLRKVFQRL